MPTAAKPVTATYVTQISTVRLPSGPPRSAADWIKGLPLYLTVEFKDSIPVTTVTLADVVLLGGPDNAVLGSLVAAADGTLTINFDLTDLSSIACDGFPDMYLAGTATLAAGAASFAGSVTSTCKDQSGAGTYGWHGRATDATATVALRDALREVSKHLKQTGERR